MKTTIEMLCRLRFECRDWQEALCGEREGLDELLAEVDSTIAENAALDGYLCGACAGEVPHDSDVCPHCCRVDDRLCNSELDAANRLEAIASELDSKARGIERMEYKGGGQYSAREAPLDEETAAQVAALRRAAAIIRQQGN